MAAYAEGLNILKHGDVGKVQRTTDAETTPLRNPEYYQFDINLPEVAEVWRRGSVIGSWLLDLTASALRKSPGPRQFRGPRFRFRRRALDLTSGHRRRRARTCDQLGVVFPLRLKRERGISPTS